MICCERRPALWACGVAVALAGFSGMVLLPSTSFAQYPGSAGDLSAGASGASSSASSSGSSSSAATSPSGVSSDASGHGSSGGSMAGSGFAGGGSDGNDGGGSKTAKALLPKKSVRKRALIRQFRFEFSKTVTSEAGNNRPLRALSADVYLEQFSEELDAGLDQQADINSLGRDLGLVRDALDDRLDEVIDSFGGEATRRGFFLTTASAGESVSALRNKIQKLKLKHELLVFGEYSLQAMGYYAK